MLKGENYTNQLYESHASRLAINTMINGECGIIDNYGNEMRVTYNNNIITIASGFAVIKGGLINETTSSSLNATLTDGLYYSVVLEIDLSQSNTRQEFNQGSFKLISKRNSYPTLQQDDLSLLTNTGKYQMELARFQTTNSAIINFTDTRNILSYNSLVEQLRAAISQIIAGDISADEISYNKNTTVKEKIDQLSNEIVTTVTTKINGGLMAKRVTGTGGWYGDHDRDYTYATPSGYTFVGLINPLNNSGNHNHTANIHVKSMTDSQVIVSCYFHGSDQGTWTWGYTLLYAKTESGIVNITK
jgi:hypothetical protein